jgi:hypothetical protein
VDKNFGWERDFFEEVRARLIRDQFPRRLHEHDRRGPAENNVALT